MADLVRVDDIGYKRRNPWGVFLLAIVTLGIYQLVWYYKINNELRNYEVDNEPALALVALTLGSVLVIPPFVSLYRTAARIKQAQDEADASARMLPVLGLLMFMFLSGFALPYYQSQLNKVWDAEVERGARIEPA